MSAAKHTPGSTEPVAYANPVILLPDEDGEEWVAKVQSHCDDVFSLPLYVAPQQQWQPIAMAPKDGTRFLAICDTGLIRLVRWDDKLDRFPIGDEPGGCWPTEPTHYMPLPEAPTQGAAP